jgi:hypothetical protein
MLKYEGQLAWPERFTRVFDQLLGSPAA